MMRKIILATMLAATTVGSVGAVATPAFAQSYSDRQRWDAAQQRYRVETDRFNAERDRFFALQGRGGGRGYGAGYNQGYAPPPPPPGGYDRGQAYNDDRYDPNYDASRYYRDGSGYQERTLASDDRVYRGSDGRYYCRRTDGTTGLVIGAASGGILGNVIDGGHSRTAGTLIGAAIGALAGKAVEQNQQQIRCR